MSTDEKLVYMANQVAGFFRAQGEARAVTGVAEHLIRFWEPPMRKRLLELAKQPDAELNEFVRKALPLLQASLSG